MSATGVGAGLRRNHPGSVFNDHMAISVRDRKLLWGLAASRCAFPDCKQELFAATEDGQGEVLLGQEAHIVAQADDGPRGHSDLTRAQRDTYENLILLCAHHHLMIDTDDTSFPVDRLSKIKADHELWVRSNLAAALTGLSALEHYGAIIDEWSERAALDHWTDWSSDIDNPTSPRMALATRTRLAELGIWMKGVIWPGTFPDLERAFSNFNCVLVDFVDTFDDQADISSDNSILRAVVRPPGNDPAGRHRAQIHAHLIVDLMFELTRAANHVCAMIRSSGIDGGFRLRNGALLMSLGALGERLARPEYYPEDLMALYPGLEAFHTVRTTRDLCRGDGS
jgi:hypothetical protein